MAFSKGMIEEEWRSKNGEPSSIEEHMLDFGFDIRPNSRLSCQIKIIEDLNGLIMRAPSRQA